MINIYESQSANRRKSAAVIIFFIIFVSAAIYFISQGLAIYLGYQSGSFFSVAFALIISGVMSWVGYYYSDRIVLGISKASPAVRNRDFDFYTVAENLSIAAGLPKPKLYVIEDSSPNAFATGRDPKHAVICATRGLLDKLNRTELEGVIGHEMTHIKNYDTRLMSVVAVLVGTVALLGNWLIRARWFGSRGNDREQNPLGVVMMILGIIFALLSPIIAQLIQLAISRRREFMGDAGSVAITHQPSGLISALKKISEDPQPLREANNATAHLFIVNPLKGKKGQGNFRFSKLFNTHPPIEDRIRELQKMQ